MAVPISNRVVSILTYFTFGMFGIIWLIYAYVAKIQTSSYLKFNIYQSLFLSIIFAVISLVNGIAIDLLSIIPLIGKLAINFNILFNQAPLFFGFTISGLIVTLLVCFLSLFCLIGKRPYIPFVSEVVKNNFGV